LKLLDTPALAQAAVQVIKVSPRCFKSEAGRSRAKRWRKFCQAMRQ